MALEDTPTWILNQIMVGATTSMYGTNGLLNILRLTAFDLDEQEEMPRQTTMTIHKAAAALLHHLFEAGLAIIKHQHILVLPIHLLTEGQALSFEIHTLPFNTLMLTIQDKRCDQKGKDVELQTMS
jgi:hypothetical protein